MNWQNVVENTVTGLGYDLVDCERSPKGLLRVYIDRVANDPAGEYIVVEDCEKVTRQLQHVLEVEGCAYERLEVSSPGLDRPLKKAADYARFAGEQIELTLKLPFQGRKKFRGELQALGDGWRLLLPDASAAKKPGKAKPAPAATTDGAALALDFSLDEVRDAHLVAAVDFKGRRAKASPDKAVPAQAPRASDDVDGGRIQ